MRFRLLLWCFWWGINALAAQSLIGPAKHLWQGMEIGVDALPGKLLIHRPQQMTFALPDPFWAASIELRKQLLGQRYWQQQYGYPKLGWTAQVQNFGNNAVLGRSYSLYPFIDLSLLRGQGFDLMFRMGYSFAWLDHKYERESNPENTAIGSHLNNLTCLGLLAEYQFAPNWRIRLGGQLTHTSNARYQQPNLGLNTAKIRLGLSYQIQAVDSLRHFDYGAFPFRKRWRPYVNVALAGKEQKIAGGPRYLNYALSMGAGWMVTPKHQWHVGLTFGYDEATAAFMRDQEIPFGNANPKFRPLRPALLLGHEFMFGRVGILTQTFWYLDKPLQGDEFMGFQLGPSLYWHQPQHSRGLNVYMGMYLKAHKAVADHVALTVGAGW